MVGGTPEVIAPVLWQVIVRELSPLLACLVVIGRASALLSEQNSHRCERAEKIEILDSQGVDPMTYLVMPHLGSGTQRLLSFDHYCFNDDRHGLLGLAASWMSSAMPWSDFLRRSREE